ncbi:MAG: mercury resistance system transport protein MerF [Nitrospiraceae bacterium]|nr:mercury resistance system transport protein MerF [Nitrospiraceae bacterium]
MEENRRKRLLRTGVIGSGLVALCCVTPILVLLLGVIGLGAITGYLDYMLLPALAVFLGLAVYAGAGQRQATGGACCTPHESDSRER